VVEKQQDDHVMRWRWRHMMHLTKGDFEKLYLQEWPPATMSKEDFDRNRGCPHHSHDCTCNGQCEWRIRRDQARERQWRSYRKGRGPLA